MSREACRCGRPMLTRAGDVEATCAECHAKPDYCPCNPLRADPEPDIEMELIASKYAAVDWAEAWAAKPPEVNWLIRPFIEAGTVNSLYATPGTGKSLIALEWSLKLARSGRTVVYIDEENRLAEDVIDRLQAMGAMPGELDKLVFYSFASLPPLDTPVGGMHLLALAVANDAELVVIDTASRMIAGGENDADTWLSLYRNAIKPLKSRNIAVLRIDHPGKDNEKGQRGSSAKNGDVDTVWRLDQLERGKPFYRMKREKSRSGHGENDTIQIERKFSPLRHVWESESDSKTVRGARDRSVEKPRFQVIAEALDRAGIPLSAGRDRCRSAADSLNIAASNALLNEVVKYRKTRPDSSGQLPVKPDSSAPQSGGANCPSAPPPHKGGGGGQVAPDQSPGSGQWPAGSIGSEVAS